MSCPPPALAPRDVARADYGLIDFAVRKEASPVVDENTMSFYPEDVGTAGDADRHVFVISDWWKRPFDENDVGEFGETGDYILVETTAAAPPDPPPTPTNTTNPPPPTPPYN